MKNRSAVGLVLVLCALAVAACEHTTEFTQPQGQTYLVAVNNDRRFAFANVGKDKQAYVCVEPYSIAGSTKDISLLIAAAVDAGTVSGNLGFDLQTTSKLYQLIQVGEVMQLANAALYRLCEGMANGAIDPKSFAERHKDTLHQTATLMLYELARENLGQASAIAQAVVANPTSPPEQIQRAVTLLASAQASAAPLLASRGDLTVYPETSREWVGTIPVAKVFGSEKDSTAIKNAAPLADWLKRLNSIGPLKGVIVVYDVNATLAAQRANAIADEFKRQGIPPERLIPTGRTVEQGKQPAIALLVVELGLPTTPLPK